MNFYNIKNTSQFLYGDLSEHPFNDSYINSYFLFTGILYHNRKCSQVKNYWFGKRKVGIYLKRLPKKFKKYIESNLWLLDVSREGLYRI